MYQALYRKWRPRTFSEMAGQEAIVRTLRNQVITGRIAHAYLFCGSRGTGKTTAAKIMARAINCERAQNGDPCLECPSCLSSLSDQSLDIYEMDAASNSRVEEIRELLEKVGYPPQQGRYKVYIIDETHMLSTAAFNALLKTLEEPPSYMVFILATTEPQKLPATILSRCQRFDFGRLTPEQMIGKMREAVKDNADEDALYYIARAAEGSMRDAWSLLDMCMGEGDRVTEKRVREALGAADRGFVTDYLRAILTGARGETLKKIDDLMLSGRDAQVFLRDAGAALRRLIAGKLSDAYGLEASEDELAKSASLSRMTRALDLMLRAETDMRYASSPRAVLELMSLRACESPEAVDITALSERVEELEKRLAELALHPPIIQNAEKQTEVEKEIPPVREKKERQTEVENQKAPDQKDPKDIWNEALACLRKEQPSLCAIINTGKYGGFKEGCYYLKLEKEDSFVAESLNAQERKTVIEEALSRIAGSPARFMARTSEQEQTALDNRVRRDTGSLFEMFGRDKVQVDDE